MVIPIEESLFRITSLGALATAVLLSMFVLYRFSDLDRLLDPLRERFVFGIPWGSLIIIFGVYCFYYLVQGGGEDAGPIVVGFRSWSIWYPQGIFFSSFAHSSHSHLVSNLFGTLAFAPIVEFAWGHYARQESDSTTSTGSDRTVQSNPIDSYLDTPVSRIAMFVFVVFLIGIGGSLFVPGAVIGFSGVVFAFAGFALVYKPLLAVLAILGIRAVRLLRDAFLDPWITATAQPRFVSPSWADVALQGHLFGLVVGALLAVFLIRFRGEYPNVILVWFALLVFAVTRSMWAVYWYLGGDSFILYRAVGVAGIILLATVIAITIIETSWSPFSRFNLEFSLRDTAVAVLIVIVSMLAVAGLAYNLVLVSPGEDVEEGMEVNDYTVMYVDSTEDQYIGAVSIPFVADGLSSTVSGVVVASDDRNAWELSRSSNRLAFEGRAAIPVGDATWRETVYINRTEWSFVDGNTTYKVYGQVEGSDRRLLYTDTPAASEKLINHTNVSIRPTQDFYNLVVERNQTLQETVRIPRSTESVTVADITFERDDADLFARHSGTEIRIATYRLDRR